MAYDDDDQDAVIPEYEDEPLDDAIGQPLPDGDEEEEDEEGE